MRFESDGASRKEVHTRVRINNELGARQFAHLSFDYYRIFENIEIPLMRITHPSGGIADILPTAISDQPNPAVVDAPAYADVRRKSVRVLGLAPGDVLEYRIVTTVTHAPLAPDFYLTHSFAQGGLVTQELFELDLPASRQVQLYVNAATPATSTRKSGADTNARTVYRWERKEATNNSESSKAAALPETDVIVTTFESWPRLANRLAKAFQIPMPAAPEIIAKASAIVAAANPGAKDVPLPRLKIEALYDFVSQKIRTVDLPLGATGFRTRTPVEILASGYAAPEDKYVLFCALASAAQDTATASTAAPIAAFVATTISKEPPTLPRPSAFDHLLTFADGQQLNSWLDLNIEVAPFGMVPAEFRGRRALLLHPDDDNVWRQIPLDLPFAAKQRVDVDAALAADGNLAAKVHYSLRGDNELLLRLAFHQTPKEKWKDLAQLLSISDGFRGQVSKVATSDPAATHEPFTLDYEITMPKFVDWSKKPVRIPALLPQLSLPDVSTEPGPDAPPIELGTPLDVETRSTLQLPPGTTAYAPTGTSVKRDYATFVSGYSIEPAHAAPNSSGSSSQSSASRAIAWRHIHFILREISAARAADYNAFVRAVQNDEAQEFSLDSGTPVKGRVATENSFGAASYHGDAEAKYSQTVGLT
jgi:hypothetical protein